MKNRNSGQDLRLQAFVHLRQRLNSSRLKENEPRLAPAHSPLGGFFVSSHDKTVLTPRTLQPERTPGALDRRAARVNRQGVSAARW
jgi:hypothetical protein